MADIDRIAGWRYISNAKGAKWTVQKNRPTHIETWPGYTVEPVYSAAAIAAKDAELSRLRGREEDAISIIEAFAPLTDDGSRARRFLSPTKQKGDQDGGKHGGGL